MSVDQRVLEAIPQRPPFLFVDKIIDRVENKIHTQKLLTGNEDFFKGHFPGNPVMPGVLLQEACFQTGAVLMSAGTTGGLGVVSRVSDVKYRQMVKPMELLDIHVELTETISNAYYFKGKIEVAGKTVMSCQFTCSLV